MTATHFQLSWLTVKCNWKMHEPRQTSSERDAVGWGGAQKKKERNRLNMSHAVFGVIHDVIL